MKTKLYSIALMIFSLIAIEGFSCTIQGNGLLKNQSEAGFTNIALKTYANVIITQGDKTEAIIKTDDNTYTNIRLEVVNDKLIISASDKKMLPNHPTVYVTLKTLNKVELTGSGNVSFANQLKSNSLEFRLTGSGNLKANFDAKAIKIVNSGSGHLEMAGKTGSSNITISGSGNVNGQDLKASKSKIKISGSGTSIVDVEEELEVDITGSGNVYFISYPERVLAVSYGSGRCEKLKA